MNETPTRRLPAHLTVALALSQLLQRLEGSAVPVDAEQYRLVAKRLTDVLAEAPPDAALRALLSAFAATAELYENLNYQHAGLCRSPLEPALAAELSARQVIAIAARAAPAAPRA